MYKWTTSLCLACFLSLVLGWVQPTRTHSYESEQVIEQAESPAADDQNSELKSGYEDIPQFGGPNSAGAQLKEDDAEKEPVFRFHGLQRALKPYFGFKDRLNKQLGLTFGVDYTALYQGATKSLGEDQAASGIFRFFGTWTLLGRNSGNTGSIVYKVENRHRLGTDIAPQDLGFAIGYAGLTAGPFTDFGWGVTNLYWQQRFKDGRVSFIAGVVDATDYVDIYGLVNPWTAFSNLAFSTDPTIPVPNQGLGAAFGAMPVESLYVVAGFADANGDATEAGFDSFFDDREYFYHLEVGWTPSFERRYFDNVHITGWYANERDEALVPDGWGLAFSFTRFINDKWVPFLRAGFSEDGGALWEGSVSTGFGYYMKRRSDLLGLGLNWSRPSATGVGPDLDDQYTSELFYRLQFSQNFALTPDIQWIINPALNPDEDQIWVFGIRGRLSL